MGKNFIQLKRKAFLICLIKSALLGLGAGALLAGVALLLTSFEAWSLKPICALPFGLGGAVAAGVGGYFLLHSSDGKLAKHLDEEFSLQEKVQTMLAYEREEGAIYRLQREDANAAVAAVSGKRLNWKRFWIYIVCACIGVGALICGFAFKPKEEELLPPALPEEEFALTDIQAAAMEELILYVQKSDMDSPYKENVTDSLQTLLGELKIAATVNERDAALEKAVDEIYKQTDASSLAVELMDALWMGAGENQSVKRLAEALNYYDWAQSDEYASFSGAMTSFRSSFVHADALSEEPDEEKMTSETAELLGGAKVHIESGLTRAGVSKTDGVYVQLIRLAAANETDATYGSHLYGFTTISENAETLGYTLMQKELDAIFAAVASGLFEGLQNHAENTNTGEYAMTKLKELFGYTLPQFERPNFYESSSGDTSEGEGGGGGGIGSGPTYGSDDLVLDPMTNTYVEYGTILDKYYSLMFGKLEGDEYTEEEKAAMEKYFEILYGETKQEGEE